MFHSSGTIDKCLYGVEYSVLMTLYIYNTTEAAFFSLAFSWILGGGLG
jgi:hypothetical protein